MQLLKSLHKEANQEQSSVTTFVGAQQELAARAAA